MNCLLVASLLISATLFLYGSLCQGKRVNQNMEAADQSAYMEYAKGLRVSHFHYLGDRNRMPVYPALMSLFYREGMVDEEFFAIGKRVGIGIAIAVLVASFWIFVRNMQTLEALTVVLVTAFTAFVYKAPYFQTDVLYYGLSFGLFVVMTGFIARPSFAGAIVVGIIAGITHLTKASVFPAVILCVLYQLLSAVLARNRPVGKTVGCAALTAAVFLVVISPYLLHSKARFGQYFYNVNSTFYVWCDSWPEVVNGVKAHGDREHWPDMPVEQIPSMRKYLREHSTHQIVMRLVDGLGVLRRSVTRSYGYASFVLLYFGFAVLLIAQNWGHFGDLAQSRPAQILLLFLVSYFSVYTVLYAWYTPIVSGNRLILSLFLPAMFCLTWVVDHAANHGLNFSICGRVIPASSVSPLILVCLAVYVLLVFPEQITKMSGGH